MTRTIALLVLAAGAAAPLGAQPGFWREDERVIITDQSVVYAVAATDQRVYAATATGLAVYDRLFRQWEPPVTVADGYPVEPVTVALHDPADDALWLGTPTAVVRYRPVGRMFETFIVPGGVRDLAFDRNDTFRGLYMLTAAGWQLLPRGAFSPMPAPPPGPAERIEPLDPAELEARVPFIRTMGAQVLLDDRLRNFQFTSGARVPNTEEYYLGTNGMGLVFVDALVAQITPMPSGLLSPGAAAVLAVDGGVWVGSDGQGHRDGLTFVSDDLQRVTYEEGPPGTGFRATVVRALAARGPEIWAATDHGIVRVEPGAGTRRLQTVDGLPDDDVFALAETPRGTWVGTARGVVFVPADTVEILRTEGPPVPALALTAAADSAWVGLTEGLGLAAPDRQIFVAPGADTLPELRSAVVAVARRADTVVAATPERLIWRAGTGPWVVGRVLNEVAPIYALAADAGGLWVGGRVGLARVKLDAGAVTPFPVPRDVPGAVRGIAPTERYLWVATEAGLVRFSRSAIEP